MLFFKLILLSLLSLATTDLRVLFFTMDSCPPCKQTEPNVDRLREEGVAVSKIDVRQYSDYARQCQVQRTPTVLIVDGDKVVARHTGALGYADLRQMLAQSATTNVSAPARAPDKTTSNNHSPDLSPEERAHRATVRFRVEDGKGVSFATGTIIHCEGNEALVLTCGHVFRDSKGKGKINTDLGFAVGKPTTVIGNLLYYDADDHDIALVAIPCPMEIEPIRVAPEQLAVQTGDKIFTLGCDRGADPSIRQSVMKARTKYSGVTKYDIVGRPVDGRSGGGLFSAGGQLIGVCNAAAVEVDEGIYTGLQSIYWQFAKTNLTHLFRRDAVPSKLSFEPETQLAERDNTPTPTPTPTRTPVRTIPAVATTSQASIGQLAHPGHRNNLNADQIVARNDELTPPVNPAVFRGGQIPVASAVYRGNEMPIRQASNGRRIRSQADAQADSQTELIVIVRSRDNPNETETLTINNPDAETLEWLRSSAESNSGSATTGSRGSSGGNSGGSNRMARLPRLQRPVETAQQQQMRGQSPR